MKKAQAKRKLEEELEYALTRSIRTKPPSNLKGFWCDGIALDSHELLDNRMSNFKGTAFFGSDGQDQYKVHIELGIQATMQYRHGGSVLENFDLENSINWYQVNLENREIRITIK
jgi:hypothetical protein